jgi:O-antigen/teichoic acid export membrane protein
LLRNSFFQDVLKIASGTGASQAILLVTFPALTRIYSPDAIGLLAVFTAITSSLVVISCLRYELAIVLPRSERAAANVLALCWLVVWAGFALTLPLFFYLNDYFQLLFRVTITKDLALLISVSCLLQGLYLALNFWNIRQRRFGRLALTKIFQSSLVGGLQIAFGLLIEPSPHYLVLGFLAGNLSAVLVLTTFVWKTDGPMLRDCVKKSRMVFTFKRYIRFPKYSAASGFLNEASAQIPMLLLAAFFSPAIVGFYAVSHKALYLPSALVGSAIGQAFFPRASQARIDGDCGSLVEATLANLIRLSVLPFLVLIAFAPLIFRIFFGVEWEAAGRYAQILAPSVAINFLFSPLSVLLSVFERQKLSLIVGASLSASRVFSVFIGGYIYNDIYLTLYLISLTATCCYGGLLVLLLKISGAQLSNTLKIAFIPERLRR